MSIHHKLPDLKKARLKGKRVLIRVGFNVPIRNGKVADDFRIRKAIPTIKYVVKKGGIPILLTHLEPVKSIAPVKKHVEKLLGHEIEFLENTRFHPGEKKNSADYAKRLARFGDVYVNEAFSNSHRKHASMVGIPKYLPSYAGFLFVEEVKKLEEVLDPKHPFLFILGGRKFETKVKLMKKFLGIADGIYVGGATANAFLRARGFPTGKSEIEKKVNSVFLKDHVFTPIDVVVQRKVVRDVEDVRKSDVILDAGPKTVKEMKGLIKDARMVLWNGPLGNTEKGYTEGTEALIRALTRANGKVVIGGGDTHLYLKGKEDAFYHISTGGGAMLDFLADGDLPGINALLKK